VTSDDLIPMAPEEGVERFLAHMESGWRDSTYENAVTRLNHFLAWFHESDLEDLNDLHGRALSDFVAWRREDVKPITLQKQLTTPRQALRFWANLEAVPEGLAEKLQAPELPDGAESSDVVIDRPRVHRLLEYHDRHSYASRHHVLAALWWRTGMRRSATHSLDVDDLRPEENALVLEHRPEEGTKLKNGEAGERWVYLGPRWYQIVEDYVNNPDRPDVEDEHGREPLITTRYGRIHPTTLTDNCYRMTRPCQYGECPVGREPEECRGTQHPEYCPEKRGPHAFRRAAISYHLLEKAKPDAVSERCDVSLKTLYRHYDIRTEREKMEVRKDEFPDS
jgi:site-specific recombinase XerD